MSKRKPRDITGNYASVEGVRDMLVLHRQENTVLTQYDMAEAMETTQGYVSAFERGLGSREPYVSSVQRYAEALGMDVLLIVVPMSETRKAKVAREAKKRARARKAEAKIKETADAAG